MEFALFKTLWGHTASVAQGAQLARAAGFRGIEAPLPAAAGEREAFARALADSRLEWIAEICTAGSYVPERSASPQMHLEDLERQILAARPLAPRFFNVMGGCDAWALDVQLDFFARAEALAQRLDVTCSFETHRGRSFFNPWITREVLRALPQLRITCDFSHWVVVCERLMDSEWDVITEVAERAHHVHGRVGYEQGPQVPHPAAPEYAAALASHERCWEAIWESQRRRGYALSTMTPEFGPDGYLHQLPFTAAPVADLWEINRWIGERERDRFACWLAAAHEPPRAMACRG